MANKNKLLSILSDAEQDAMYGLPDFDDSQRLEFLALNESELALACSRRGLHAQMYCIIQIAYFKAKHLFFRFGWDDVPDDCSFVLSRYFPGESLPDKLPYKQERYAQREQICALYGYRPWSSALSSPLEQQAARIVHRDVTPGFVATELIIWLNEHKIIRPGYTTLQELVSRALSDERQRLGRILMERLDDATIDSLNTLIERDDTLSRLAILRQDARDFGWRQMVREREKRAILAPLHRKGMNGVHDNAKNIQIIGVNIDWAVSGIHGLKAEPGMKTQPLNREFAFDGGDHNIAMRRFHRFINNQQIP